MLSREDRKKIAEEMDKAPAGTVVLVVLTDGRLWPSQKGFSGYWAAPGVTRNNTPEDIMEIINIRDVEFHYERNV